MASLAYCSPEDAYIDESDGPTPRERELEAYHPAVVPLDDEDIRHVAGSYMASHSQAMVELVRLQRLSPYEDVTRAHIYDSLAQDLARDCLIAIAASIDDLSGMRHASQEGR